MNSIDQKLKDLSVEETEEADDDEDKVLYNIIGTSTFTLDEVFK